jgi:hypothetical protein
MTVTSSRCPRSIIAKHAESTLFIEERDPFDHAGQMSVGAVLRSVVAAFIWTGSLCHGRVASVLGWDKAQPLHHPTPRAALL